MATLCKRVSSVAGASVNPKLRCSCRCSLFLTPSPHPLSFVAGGSLRRCSVTLSALLVFQITYSSCVSRKSEGSPLKASGEVLFAAAIEQITYRWIAISGC
ncbi:hypothetical protein PIB30_057876 [Stylosanthes scabra]|uniref:Uncharacterized protein n=1 Tax=Stylosanthes scabra TaxID=79078 RepID=A0ABU6SJX2_9FABA|nr:hypothetical protein [Stylosanthes scabra]